MATHRIEVLVRSIRHLAEGINAWELCAVGGEALPPFTAGAHIDLFLQNGLARSYSLVSPPEEGDHYVVAVNNDRLSRGGSRFIHETLRAGDRLWISAPINNFPLVETCRHSVFIAGGIGITPIWAMIDRLERLGGSWELHYSARQPQTCAFMRELRALESKRSGRAHFNFDHVAGGQATDLAALIGGFSPDVHLYCCGPSAMLQAFENATAAAGYPASQIHVEYFAPRSEAATGGGYTVVLGRSGREIEVPAGKTILMALQENDADVPFSCMEGICGTCETRVLDGIPDHRDSVLTETERASNRTMMICCSGSRTSRLVLDL